MLNAFLTIADVILTYMSGYPTHTLELCLRKILRCWLFSFSLTKKPDKCADNNTILLEESEGKLGDNFPFTGIITIVY